MTKIKLHNLNHLHNGIWGLTKPNVIFDVRKLFFYNVRMPVDNILYKGLKPPITRHIRNSFTNQ